MPTPNGRIHLGHSAGPYLKMDVLKRTVQRHDGTAYLCSGSDVYESYVELKAAQLHLSTVEVANHFHALIARDFQALDIDFDLFINPLDADLVTEFVAFEQGLLSSLVRSGHAIERDEWVPYDPINERYLTGCWLTGECPNCHHATGSYSCEQCGYHYRPQDIFQQAENSPVELIADKALYLRLDAAAVLDNARTVNQGAFQPLVARYLALQGPFIRLSTWQETGVPCNRPPTKDQVLFTYTGLAFYSIFCGHLLQRQYGLADNPLSASCDFITCASCGIDNMVPYLTGVHGVGASLPGYRSFDHYFGNYFYYLDGAKFSTSRLHVIWNTDIVELSGISPDAVRYYLCRVNPEARTTNFDSHQFVDIINQDLSGRLNAVVGMAFRWLEVGTAYVLDGPFLSQIATIIDQQNQAARPESFRFSSLLPPVDDWIHSFESMDVLQQQQCAYWWLKTLAFLCYPVMPRFSTALWQNLTGTATLRASIFFATDTLVSSDLSAIVFNAITYADLLKSLPAPKNTPI